MNEIFYELGIRSLKIFYGYRIVNDSYIFKIEIELVLYFVLVFDYWKIINCLSIYYFRVFDREGKYWV